MDFVYYNREEMEKLSTLFQDAADEINHIQEILVHANSIIIKNEIEPRMIDSVNSVLDKLPHYAHLLCSLSEEAKYLSYLFKPIPPLDQ